VTFIANAFKARSVTNDWHRAIALVKRNPPSARARVIDELPIVLSSQLHAEHDPSPAGRNTFIYENSAEW
jgi:hypothetical protein